MKRWDAENIEKRREYRLKYYYANKEKYKKYQEGNADKYRKYFKEYRRKKRLFDEKLKISERISARIRASLKNKRSNHWEDLVGYTKYELIEHLKLTMPEGYAWNDYLNGGLHIDHIIPISAFNFDEPNNMDFKRCWSLKNLRLLPAKENLRKRNKLYNPFQPALKL